MQQLKPRLIDILQKYMSNPSARVGNGTTLSELEIGQLDLPMILLDVEDVFDVQINCLDEI
jgi:acyl carrier protein